MPISFESKGSFRKTQTFLQKAAKQDIFRTLDRYGQRGVSALAAATPAETGQTGNSWTYKITSKRGFYEIAWENTHEVKGANIAILLQYGHGTRQGGYVQGRDYINPAMQPIFDSMAETLWREVTSL